MNKLLLGLAVLSIGLGSCGNKGCTDMEATNYDPTAKKDDGSCIMDTTTTIIDGGDTNSTNAYTIPTTYVFTDDAGNNTVSYSGQTDRLDMLAAMTTYMKTANTSGVEIDAQKLKDMFANTNSAFDNADLNASTKQIQNKTFALDTTMFLNYMDSIAAVSMSDTVGSNGVAGVVTSNDGQKAYLFDANGVEYTQLIEKGLMGALIYYQITSVYLSDDKIGSLVDNTLAVDAAAGKYYTAMEHHFDEAFGYFGVPVDFPTNTADVRFAGKYTNGRDGVLGSNTALMNAFLKGRAAISNDDADAKAEAVVTIQTELEKVYVGTAIHYLNGAIDNIADDAIRNHEISEAVAFIGALKYSAAKNITDAEITTIIESIGSNFYEVSVNDLNSAKDQLSTIYSLDAVKDQL